MTAVDLAAEFFDRHGPLRDRGWSQRADGLLLPPSFELAPPKPTGLDLFAGAGGFSCGFHQAGWHVVAASEWWPVAVETYLANLGSPSTRVYVGETAAPDATKKERQLFEARGGQFIMAEEFFELLPLPSSQRVDGFPGNAGRGWISSEDDASACEVFFCCDVQELTGDFILDSLGLAVGELGCVFGGPPCQGFSVANVNANKDDPRNQLVFEFARLVVELQPQTMVMENVPAIVNMVTPEGVPVIDALSLILSTGGMGEYEALRRSLLANAGAGAIVKGAKRPGRKRDAVLEDDEQDGINGVEVEQAEQLALEVLA